ncbi:MAG TPA: GH3 auxin-responsive promoter family protein [Bacteroidales bacterium]|nr:GH3 auxin-responsive promoter family protein [Bacteroidales bacterium]
MDLLSGLYSIYLKDRFGEIQGLALDASDIQSEQLSNLLLEAAETEWGKKYDFKSIFSYQEFRERLPIQRLTDLKPYLQRMSMGETDLIWPGTPKDVVSSMNDTMVPITAQAITETFQKGISDSYTIHICKNPGSKLLEGFSANVGNGVELPFMNELHALLRENEPFLNSLLNLPKRVGEDKDGNPSSELVLKEALGQKVTSFKGSSLKLQELLDKACRKTGKKSLKELWPDAEVLFVRSPANSTQLEESKSILPEGLIQQATYCSPEGLFGIQDDPNDPSFMLLLDLSIFFEFIPTGGTDQDIVPLEDTEAGIDYQMVLTNCSGLWRCCSEGPRIRFVSIRPYRFILL